VVPVLLLDLWPAVVTSVAWGALALTALSVRLARAQGVRAGPVVLEHLAVGAAVIALAHAVGRWIGALFG